LEHLREGARVVLCGRISQTLAAEPYGIRNLNRLAAAHGRMQGFLVFNYHERYGEARAWLAPPRPHGRLPPKPHLLARMQPAGARRPRDAVPRREHGKAGRSRGELATARPNQFETTDKHG